MTLRFLLRPIDELWYTACYIIVYKEDKGEENELVMR
jgi:hypothetical protein